MDYAGVTERVGGFVAVAVGLAIGSVSLVYCVGMCSAIIGKAGTISSVADRSFDLNIRRSSAGDVFYPSASRRVLTGKLLWLLA